MAQNIAACLEAPDCVAFLDIETTGLSHYYDDITIIGWSIGAQAKTVVQGDDYSELLFDLAKARALVTFNGTRFDTKFLKRDIPNIQFPEAHLDLMYLCRRFGLTGGQKAIEKALNINVRNDIASVDGAHAVVLWHQYLRGNLPALKELIRYNRADIAAMGVIFDKVLALLEQEPTLFSREVFFFPWSAPKNWTTIPTIFSSPKIKFGNRKTFATLFHAKYNESSRIVGIDLSGSENRRTGWCFLEGNVAHLRVVFTDDEIMNHTINAKPQLVSIDSPLCLPRGRLTVYDDDETRRVFGITRECERILRQRGINVYPCLIKSMQKLTSRGITISTRLRELGIPVIESYPGAAQDIMRIPRKGAGKELLKRGLQDFGIDGEVSRLDVTHDELDALTSAIVGQFHMNNLVEPLGGVDEAPLMVPRLDNLLGTQVIGISGRVAAGKTTLARALERRGYAYTRYSLAIDDVVKERGLPRDRKSRQSVGEEINSTGRQRWLGEKTIGRVAGSRNIVVDGIRFWDDLALLVERFGGGLLHVHVSARADVRQERYERDGSTVPFHEADRAMVERYADMLETRAQHMFVNEKGIGEIERFADGLAKVG